MGNADLRITGPLLRVMQVFLTNPSGQISGTDLMSVTSLASGTLYPMLKRLEVAKWLESEWEDVSPQAIGRPRRRLYRITGVGAGAARRAIKEIHPAAWEPAWTNS